MECIKVFLQNKDNFNLQTEVAASNFFQFAEADFSLDLELTHYDSNI